MNITFYTFAKRRNSTKIPSGGTTYSCVLKDGASVLNPSIQLEAENPVSYNYAYIPLFGRYYWVDWTNDYNDIWTAALKVDPLASWRTGIRSSSQYVTRSGSASDSFIVDGKYAITTDLDLTNIDVTGSDGSTHRPFMNGSYKYIISTTNGADNSSGNPQKLGGASYYVLTPGAAQMFMGYLLQEPTYMSLNVDEISDNLAKGLINPIQYIGECYILGYEPQETLRSSSLWCGWWPVDVDHVYDCLPSYSDLHKWDIWESQQIVIPSHPQTSVVGQFVNASGYTSVTLFAGIFGSIPIDPMLTARYPNWKCQVKGDFKGRCELDVLFYNNDTTSWVLWDRFYAETAIPISMSQLTSDGIKAVSGVASSAVGVAGGLSKGDPFKAIGSIFSGIGSVVGALNPHIAGQAKGASTAYLQDNWFVQTEHHLITETASGLLGSPLCKVKTLSDLSGYCQIDNPAIELACTDTEANEILSYMTSGFFLE